MKKIILAALALSVLVSLAGCGKKGELEPPKKHLTGNAAVPALPHWG